MRKGIHPENYRLCVFKDMSTDYAILTKSCAESSETIKWEDEMNIPWLKWKYHLIHIHFIQVSQNLLILLDVLISLRVNTKNLKNNSIIFYYQINPVHMYGVFN